MKVVIHYVFLFPSFCQLYIFNWGFSFSQVALVSSALSSLSVPRLLRCGTACIERPHHCIYPIYDPSCKGTDGHRRVRYSGDQLPGVRYNGPSVAPEFSCHRGNSSHNGMDSIPLWQSLLKSCGLIFLLLQQLPINVITIWLLLGLCRGEWRSEAGIAEPLTRYPVFLQREP